MQRVHQLAELSGLIATVRTRDRVVRLALRNTDRFGLIHLYFAHGSLIHVESHGGSAASSLQDLSTWRQGAIRMDDVDGHMSQAADAAELEVWLARALAELERRGVVYPAPPALSPDSVHHPHVSSGMGLPPLDPPTLTRGADPLVFARHAQLSAVPPDERLPDPQWHLLALAVRQVTEHAEHLLGGHVADGMLRQALAQGAANNAFLAGLEVDASGWLRAREAGLTARFAAFDAVEAVAELLTAFEERCAGVLGPRRAQELITTAVAPFRTSLQQIGIIINVD